MRSRLTYANVVATLALFLAVSTGGAFAATKLIDGGRIKPGTIKTKQLARNAVDAKRIKNGSLTAADFKAGAVPAGARGAAGPAGPAGPAGATGAAGAKGDRGVSAWDPIPSGRTVTGGWLYDGTTDATDVNDNLLVGIPAKLPAEPTDVNFAEDGSAVTADDDSTCTGTVAAPTAPAGRVCLYRRSSSNVDLLRGFQSIEPAQNGFRVNVQATANGVDVYADGTWAYTAP